MRLQLLSLGLLALQVSASVLPIDTGKKHHAVRGTSSFMEIVVGNAEAPSVPRDDSLFNKRQGKKGKGGGGGTAKKKKAQNNKPSPKVSPQSSPKPNPAPGKLSLKSGPTPAKPSSPPNKSSQAAGKPYGTKSLNKTATKTQNSSVTGTPKLGPWKSVPEWPTKYAVATVCEVKKPGPSSKSATAKPATGKPSTIKPKTRHSIDSTRNIGKRRVEKRAEKNLWLNSIKLEFPNYPRAGIIIGSAVKYPGIVFAYGAADPASCSRNWAFGRIQMPSYNTPPGEFLEGNDIWNTEHVLDAQVVKAFWKKVITDPDIKKLIPRGMLTAQGRVRNPSTEEWIKEFWNDRKNGGDNAMKWLLGVYPGSDNQFVNEFTLLGAKINNKKQLVFGEKACIAPGWESQTWAQKIKELGYCIHLSKYLSDQNIQRDIQAVHGRIRATLIDMEAPGGFMETLDNYNGQDRRTEVWETLNLGPKWGGFARRYVTDAVDNLDKLIEEKKKVLEQDLDDAKELHEDNWKKFMDTEAFLNQAIAFRDRNGPQFVSRADQKVVEDWQRYYRQDRARSKKAFDDYRAMTFDYRALQAGWTGTTNPLP